MTEPFDPDTQRFLELLRHKIGFNALARITILMDDNPRLKTVQYRVASPQLPPDESMPPWSPSGELKVDDDLISRVFALALAHEDVQTPFSSTQMIFYDVLDRKHEGVKTFILLFLSPDML
jgi:hypothetical protein